MEAREVVIPRFQRSIEPSSSNEATAKPTERVVTVDLEDKLAALINAKKAALLHTLI